VKRYRDRVLVGISLTAPPSKAGIIKVVEPNASSIPERVAALEKAHRLGLRLYAMLCPLLAGVADDQDSIEKLVQIGIDAGAEEFYAEAVNRRGRSLTHTAQALQNAGYDTDAAAVNEVRNQVDWSAYVVRLVPNVQAALRQHHALDKLRFLLYLRNLTQADAAQLRLHRDGIVWLGKE